MLTGGAACARGQHPMAKPGSSREGPESKYSSVVEPTVSVKTLNSDMQKLLDI